MFKTTCGKILVSYGYRGISVHHGLEAWQQETDMLAKGVWHELTLSTANKIRKQISYNTINIHNWSQKHNSSKKVTLSKPPQTIRPTEVQVKQYMSLCRLFILKPWQHTNNKNFHVKSNSHSKMSKVSSKFINYSIMKFQIPIHCYIFKNLFLQNCYLHYFFYCKVDVHKLLKL